MTAFILCADPGPAGGRPLLGAPAAAGCLSPAAAAPAGCCLPEASTTAALLPAPAAEELAAFPSAAAAPFAAAASSAAAAPVSDARPVCLASSAAAFELPPAAVLPAAPATLLSLPVPGSVLTATPPAAAAADEGPAPAAAAAADGGCTGRPRLMSSIRSCCLPFDSSGIWHQQEQGRAVSTGRNCPGCARTRQVCAGLASHCFQ